METLRTGPGLPVERGFLTKYRIALWIAAGALIWAAVLMGFWGLQPLSDSVQVGTDSDGSAVVVRVTCNSLFANEPVDASQLPYLEPPFEFVRQPCIAVHHDARWALVINVVFVSVLLVVSILVARTIRRRSVQQAASERVRQQRTDHSKP